MGEGIKGWHRFKLHAATIYLGRKINSLNNIYNLLRVLLQILVIIKDAFDDLHPRLFAKLVMMLSAPVNSAGIARMPDTRPKISTRSID